MPIELLVNIDVDDLDKAIAFYREGLGLRPARRFGRDGIEMLGASAAVYLLVKAAGSQASIGTHQQRDYGRHWTPVHLDVVVEDVPAAVKKAVAAGAKLEGEIRTHNWGRIAQLADPFGNGFCLLEFLGRGYGEIAS